MNESNKPSAEEQAYYENRKAWQKFRNENLEIAGPAGEHYAEPNPDAERRAKLNSAPKKNLVSQVQRQENQAADWSLGVGALGLVGGAIAGLSHEAAEAIGSGNFMHLLTNLRIPGLMTAYSEAFKNNTPEAIAWSLGGAAVLGVAGYTGTRILQTISRG